MRDETKGVKTNRVILNIPQCEGVEPPEPGIAAIIIDGQPIHAYRYIQINAGVGQITTVTMTFEAEVGGNIGGVDVADRIRRAAEGQN